MKHAYEHLPLKCKQFFLALHRMQCMCDCIYLNMLQTKKCANSTQKQLIYWHKCVMKWKIQRNIKSCSNQIHAKAAVILFLPPDISRKSSSLVSYPDPESMMSWPWMTPWNVTTGLQQHNDLQHLSDFSRWHVDKRIFYAVRCRMHDAYRLDQSEVIYGARREL